MKPTLKVPGTKRLKLYWDEPPSNFALKFNLCRYSMDEPRPGRRDGVRGRGLHSSASLLNLSRF